MPLTFDEEYRYSRHLVLPGVGMAGQERLKRARVLVVGAGGLGAPVALYLAAAGVGTIGIADADTVDVSNLQRQIIHHTADKDRLKVDSAADALRALNPLIEVRPIPERITAANAPEHLAGYDVIVDGTDNFPARYLLNDACALLGQPLVFGSIFRFEGQAAVFDARRGPCYRCLFPEPPPLESVPTCAEGGVLGALPGMIGTIQANETLKLLLNIGEPLIGRLLLLDALEMRFRELRVEKNPACPLCGEAPQITALTDLEEYCGLGAAGGEWEMAPEELRARLRAGGVTLVDVREEWEREEDPAFPSSLNLPYPIFARRMTELDSAKEIVLFCSAGARSWQAAALLRRADFTRAWSLRGGLAGWRRCYPLRRMV
jgi:adenylyltransferase/sulfurtransferase